MPIVVTIPGPPVPKGRPRFYNQGGFTRTYTPAKTVEYERRVKAEFMRAMDGAPITGPVSCRLKFSMPIPKSWTKRKRAKAAMGLIRPTSRPDIDNLQKSVIDAMNNVVLVDDSQITDLIVTKRFSDEPCVEVTVSEITTVSGLEQQRCAA